MTDQSGIRDDIAFLRTLAEEGRNGPMAGGSILFAGWLIFAAASLLGLLALPGFLLMRRARRAA